MTKYLRSLTPLEIYSEHKEHRQTGKIIPANKFIRFKREKRRDKINWMEIFLEDGTIAYIKKDWTKMFRCEYSKLSDDVSYGFSYKMLNSDSLLPISDLFTQTIDQTPAVATMQYQAPGIIQAKVVEDREEQKMKFVTLKYDPNLVEVTPLTVNKGEHFYVTHQEILKDPFIEIDDFDGKKGFILQKSNIVALKDEWIGVVAIIVAIAVVLGIIIGFFAAGWIVIGGILIIPGLIVAFVVVLLLRIVFGILGGIFHQIYKRL